MAPSSSSPAAGGPSSVLITCVVIGVVYVINRIVRYYRRPAGLAPAAGAGGPPGVRTVGAGAASPVTAGAAATKRDMSAAERMRTMAFAGWKVAVDVDCLVERASTSADTSAEVRTRPDAVPYFTGLAATAELFVYCEVEKKPRSATSTASPPLEDRYFGVQAILGCLRPFKESLARERVLFCATAKGHEAFSRQLTPAIVITTRPAVVQVLARHVPYVVLVHSDSTVAAAAAAHGSNVLVVPSLAALSG